MGLTNSRAYLVLLATACCLLAACSYSFTGTSQKPGVNTITIERLDNNAEVVVPTLAQNMTEALRDQFIRQSNLKLADRNGDLNLSGFVSRYTVEPLTVQGNDQAAQNRLTIGVQIKFVSEKYPSDSWEQNIEQFADFPSTQQLSQVEDQLVEEIQEKLVQDIFNKALSNW